MGLIKTGLMLGGALLIGNAIGSGNGSTLSDFAVNIFNSFAELLYSITNGTSPAVDKDSVPVSVDETQSDTAKRAQQAADMDAAPAVETADGKLPDAGETEITAAQYESVHADAQAAILENDTIGAEVPGLGKATGQKGRENKKDLAQMLHREVSVGGFRVRDAQGNILSAEESVDLLYTEIGSRAKDAATSEELGSLTSQELKEMLKTGKGIISSDAQVHGAKLSAALKKGFADVGLDPFKSESKASIAAYADAVCEEYSLTDEQKQELLPDLKKAIKSGIHDCEWDVHKPSGEPKTDKAIFHVINRIETSGLFSRLPEADVKKEYDSGRLAGARRSLADRRVSSALSKQSDTGRETETESRTEELLDMVKNADNAALEEELETGDEWDR